MSGRKAITAAQIDAKARKLEKVLGEASKKRYPRPTTERTPVECTCAAKDMPFGRCCKAGLPQP